MIGTPNFPAVVLLFTVPFGAQAGEVILMDLANPRYQPTEVTIKNNQKVPAGKTEPVNGQFGKACRFSFVESTGPQFFTAAVNPKEDWNQYEGFSFWVKGDGSKSCGGLEFIDRDNFALRYGYCFPINSTKWVKFTVPWGDLIPELAGPPVDPRNGFSPSRFRYVWFGKWFYWREYPACSFSIERMVLEKKIDRTSSDPKPAQTYLKRVVAKLKARKPITLVLQALRTEGKSVTLFLDNVRLAGPPPGKP